MKEEIDRSRMCRTPLKTNMKLALLKMTINNPIILENLLPVPNNKLTIRRKGAGKARLKLLMTNTMSIFLIKKYK